MKATDTQLLEAYATGASCKVVAKQFGMCPQSVHERLVKLGANRNVPIITDDEKRQITDMYQSGFARGAGMVKALADRLGRPISAVYTYACSAGLCDSSRPMDRRLLPAIIAGAKQGMAKAKQNGTYVNSMRGKKLSAESKEKIGIASKKLWQALTPDQRSDRILKSMKTKVARYGRVGNFTRPGKTTWKAAWHEIGGKRIYFRSAWEANYGKYLEWLKANGNISEWEHEPETFWFEEIRRGCRSYLPDFKVTHPDQRIEFHEVKGWMDPKSKTKIRRMAKYHPAVVLVVVDSKAYRKLQASVSKIVPGWVVNG